MNDNFIKAAGKLSPRKNTAFFYGFLPNKFKESFDDGSGINLEQKVKPGSLEYINVDFISTEKIDKYRQGVEITRPVHYVIGLEQGHSKIHSGEPGHLMAKLNYGYSDRSFRNKNAFEEIDRFNSVKYLKDPNVYVKTFVTSENADLESHVFNGVIEPLTIRAVASFFSIDVPFESHSVWANLESGNASITRSYDRVVTIYERNPKDRKKPWLDMVDLVGVIVKSASPGYFNKDENYLTPFNDSSTVVELSKLAKDEMNYAILENYGDTDNYIPDGFVSATCGWNYDDAAVKGTDSIAFGGLTY